MGSSSSSFRLQPPAFLQPSRTRVSEGPGVSSSEIFRHERDLLRDKVQQRHLDTRFPRLNFDLSRFFHCVWMLGVALGEPDIDGENRESNERSRRFKGRSRKSSAHIFSIMFRDPGASPAGTRNRFRNRSGGTGSGTGSL